MQLTSTEGQVQRLWCLGHDDENDVRLRGSNDSSHAIAF